MRPNHFVPPLVALAIVAAYASALPRGVPPAAVSDDEPAAAMPASGFVRTLHVGDTTTESFGRSKESTIWSDCDRNGVARIVPHEISQTVSGPYSYRDVVVAQFPGACHLVAYTMADDGRPLGISAVLTIDVTK